MSIGSRTDGNGTLFALVISILMLQTVLLKMKFDENYGFISQLDELLVYFLLILAFKKIPIFRDKSLSDCYFIFGIYSIWSLVISVFMPVSVFSALLQFAIDAKFVIISIVATTSLMNCSPSVFEKILKILLLVNIPFVLLQLAAPELFAVIFPRGGDGIFYLLSGSELIRFSGVFEFAGILATISAACLCYFWFKHEECKSTESKFYIIISLLFLLLTISRAELVAIIAAIVLVKFLNTNSIKSILLPLILLISLFFIKEQILFIIQELGLLNSSYDDLSPRALFLKTSIDIANDYFPFGSGLGTFGGTVAVSTDSKLFYTYLIAYEWYFKYGWFLTDTYWPKYLAETGYFGAVLYMIFLLRHINLVGRLRFSCTLSKKYSISMLLFLLLTSLSSPVYSHTLTVFVTFGLLRYGLTARVQP